MTPPSGAEPSPASTPKGEEEETAKDKKPKGRERRFFKGTKGALKTTHNFVIPSYNDDKQLDDKGKMMKTPLLLPITT